MDVGRRRGANRSAVASGSIWESRMIIDQVKGGIRVFNADGDGGQDKDKTHDPNPNTHNPPAPGGSGNGFRVFRRLESGAAAKRKTWKSSDRTPSDAAPSSPISTPSKKLSSLSPSSASESESMSKSKSKSKSRSQFKKMASNDLQAVNKSPIQSNKTPPPPPPAAAAAARYDGDVAIDKTPTDRTDDDDDDNNTNNKSPIPSMKARSKSAEPKKNLMLQRSRTESDYVGGADDDSGGPELEEKLGTEEDKSCVDHVTDSKSEEACRYLRVCDENPTAIGLTSGDGKGCDGKDQGKVGDDEEDFVEVEAETSQNLSFDIKEIVATEIVGGSEPEANKAVVVVQEEAKKVIQTHGNGKQEAKKVNQSHDNGKPSIPISPNLNKQQASAAPSATPTTVPSDLNKHAPTKPSIAPNHTSQSFPAIPDLRKQSSFPIIPDLRKQSSFPSIPDFRKQSSLPAIPDLRKQSPTTVNIRKPNLRRTTSTPTSEEFQDIPERNRKLQNLVDLVMWRDVSKSALIFGIGTFIMLSSSYTKDFNLSLISIMSYLGLLNLAAIFLYKSIICRGATTVYESSEDVVGEEEAIWLLKLLLPYINEFLLKLRGLFSGDPATTMKLAVLLFFLARCGASITIWKMVKLGFWGAFTVPKIYSLYSTQLLAYGDFWVRRFQDAWDTCSHKKAVGGAIFTVVWNLSSVVVRVWAVFVLFVAVRYYQQSLVRDEWEEDEAGDGESWHGQAGRQRRGGGGPTLVEIKKEKKGS